MLSHKLVKLLKVETYFFRRNFNQEIARYQMKE